MVSTSLSAKCAFGKYHDIEVEDDVTAVMEFKNGATGVFTGRYAVSPVNGTMYVSERNWDNNPYNTTGRGRIRRITSSGEKPASWSISSSEM